MNKSINLWIIIMLTLISHSAVAATSDSQKQLDTNTKTWLKVDQALSDDSDDLDDLDDSDDLDDLDDLFESEITQSLQQEAIRVPIVNAIPRSFSNPEVLRQEALS